MSRQGHFPVVSPREAERSPSLDATIRRLAQMAGLAQGSRVLDLGCGSGWSSILIAQEFKASVVAADDDERSLEGLSARLLELHLSEMVQVEKVGLKDRLPFPEDQFDAVILYPKLWFSFAEGVMRLRPYLRRDGRLLMGYPVRVGRRPESAVLDFWERKLGEPLRLPGELLGVLSSAGFEPETISVDDKLPLEPFYESADPPILADGRATASFAQVVARRKDSDEKPPTRRRA